MSEVVEFRTGTEVSDVVDRLCATVDEGSMCLPVDRSIAEGEWVRFTVSTEDGTAVIEGVGRCAGSTPRGNPVARWDVLLAELQFDARNEVMFERMLLAKEAAKRGDDTGTIKLAEVEEIEQDIAARDESSEAKPSVPPPVPAKSLSKVIVAPNSRPAPASDDDTTTSTALPDDTTQTTMPEPGPTARPARRSTPPKTGATIHDAPYALEVDRELVTHARRLEARLPRKMLARDRKPGKPEAAVLAAAVRIGLSALEAIADED